VQSRLATALIMKATSNSETSDNLYESARREMPEDGHLHIRRSENLKSHLFLKNNKQAVSKSVKQYSSRTEIQFKCYTGG
jgi:hypothetical protein